MLSLKQMAQENLGLWKKIAIILKLSLVATEATVKQKSHSLFKGRVKGVIFLYDGLNAVEESFQSDLNLIGGKHWMLTVVKI